MPKIYPKKSKRKKVVKTSPKESVQEEDRKPWYNQDNPTTKAVVHVIMIILALIVGTQAASKFWGFPVTESGWYWIIMGCLLIIFLASWINKQTKTETIVSFTHWVIALSVAMMLINAIWTETTWVSLKPKLTGPNAVAPPPRNVAWMTHKVIPRDPTRLVRVYNGDWFIYKSPENFMIIEGYGKRGALEYLHNKTRHPGQPRKFPFFKIPPDGVDIYILSVDGKSSFEIDYKIKRSKNT